MNYFLLFSLCLSWIRIDSSIVSTSLGKLEGAEIENVEFFKKIPFAKPPIGKLRFQKPETPEKWEGVRNAKEYGPACLSNSSISKSPQKWVNEDCLHLNIVTTKNCLTSKDCAVVLYIHGGELTYDSAVMFNDSFLIDTFSKREVILAIPAFRLGIFSHFIVEDQDIAPNNVALYDILLSMEFVKNEIHNFGGDNQKITLFGHSFGAHITSMFTFSTNINNDLSLFQQAVTMSSPNYFQNLNSEIEKTELFAKKANCKLPAIFSENLTKYQQDSYMMKCLQNKDSMELLRIQRSIEDNEGLVFKGSILRGPLFQDVKATDFYESPKNIKTFAGCTRYEWDNKKLYYNIVENLNFENFEECENKYRSDKKIRSCEFGGHEDETQAMIVHDRMVANILMEKKVPVYFYEYTYPKHAIHTDDLSYLFGVHLFEKDENERKLSVVYQEMFINFVKYGEPKLGVELSDLKTESYFEVYWNETTGEKPRMKNGFEHNLTHYWLHEMVNFDKEITAAKRAKLFRSLDLKDPKFLPEDSYSDSPFISVALVLLIFLIGCVIGRHCCAGTQERNLYIRLDGDNQEWQMVKDF